MKNFNRRLDETIEKRGVMCVGLDSDVEKLPERFLGAEYPQFEFNRWIINQTHDLVCAYKPNLAFYEANGVNGWRALEITLRYLREEYPEVITIADAKRGDIGSTSEVYARAIFDQLGFDAVTLSPYLGRDTLEPFLRREDKGSIILCKTSNEGGGEVQDLSVVSSQQSVVGVDPGSSLRLWEWVARRVAGEWNGNDNCMLVVGATYPEELKRVRELVGEMPLLVPGVGTQGGSLEEVLKYGINSVGRGVVVNVSRSVIFAEDPRRELKIIKEE